MDSIVFTEELLDTTAQHLRLALNGVHQSRRTIIRQFGGLGRQSIAQEIEAAMAAVEKAQRKLWAYFGTPITKEAK